MARFHGRVGFLVPVDNQVTGIIENRVIEKPFRKSNYLKT